MKVIINPSYARYSGVGTLEISEKGKYEIKESGKLVGIRLYSKE